MAFIDPPEDTPTCLVCLDEIADVLSRRECGFCGKFICHECMTHLCEIDQEGEVDETNGDLRCPNCRGSLMEGDLHKRRLVILRHVPGVDDQIARDLVTLEDLIARTMQLCAESETGMSYYNVPPDVVAAAVARDPQYTRMLERMLPSARSARSLRQRLRKSPADKSNVIALTGLYVKQLTGPAIGMSAAAARRIVEEVMRQSLDNDNDAARYKAAWAPDEDTGSKKRVRDGDGAAKSTSSRPAASSRCSRRCRR